MKLFLRLALFLVATSAFAQTQLRSYQSGIDIVLGGTQGTHWDVEQNFSSPTTYDGKTIYIRSDTTISFAHNALNVAFITNASQSFIGVNGQDGIPDSGDEGVILYKIDRDMNWGGRWGDGGGNNTFHNFGGSTTVVPQYNVPSFTQIDSAGHSYGQQGYLYSTPFTLDSQTYESGVPVVGSYGPKIGPAVTDWANYYWRGVQDSVLDEWHVIHVADNDHLFKPQSPTGWEEWSASDSKSFPMIVNPKTSAITVTTTGNAIFYTTPPKAYFAPKICDQTTYMEPGAGSVTITLHDLYGTDTHYRINGGAYSSGSATQTITDSAFSNGTNTLDFYNDGNPTVIKRRTVVKNPTFPSANEVHGNAVWGNTAGFNAVKAAIATTPLSTTYASYKTQNMYNHQTDFDTINGTGRRNGLSQGNNSGILTNAFICAVSTNGWTLVPAGKTLTFAQYAKQMLMQCGQTIPPVGMEINDEGSYLPCRNRYYRGYYDDGLLFEMATGYDLLIANYKSTQVTGGITPVEDIYIRDLLALTCYEAMIEEGNYRTQQFTDTGMWGTARNMAALETAAIAIPSYSTPYYGTSGFDGNTTVYPRTPFPDTPLTWKKVLYDNDATLVGYPNLNYRFGVEEYMFDSSGTFTNRGVYLDYQDMGHSFYNLANLFRLNYPKIFPHMELGFKKVSDGTMVALQDPAGALSRYPCYTLFNNQFAVPELLGLPWSLSLPTTSPGTNSLTFNIFSTWTSGMLWYKGLVTIPGNPQTAPAGVTP